MDSSCLSDTKTAMVNEELRLTTSKRLPMLMRPRIGILRTHNIVSVSLACSCGLQWKTEDSKVSANGVSNKAAPGITIYDICIAVKQYVALTFWATSDRNEKAKLDMSIHSIPCQLMLVCFVGINSVEAKTIPTSRITMSKRVYGFRDSTPMRTPPINEVRRVVHFRTQMRETEIKGYAMLDMVISTAVPMLNGSATWERSDQRCSVHRAAGAFEVHQRIMEDTTKLKIVTLNG